MRTLHRYVLLEVVQPAAVGLLAITFLMVVTQVLRIGDLVFGQALGLGTLVRLVALVLPSFLVLALPIALLFGGLAGIGRLAADRELLALRAAGISVLRLVPIPLLLGGVATLLALFLAVQAEPWCMATLKRSVLDVAKENSVAALRPGNFSETLGGLSVYVDRAGSERGTFSGVFALDRREADREVAVLASTGRIRALPDALALEFRLTDGELVRAERERPVDERLTFEEYVFRVDVGSAVERRTRFIQDFSTMTPAEIKEYLATHDDVSQRDRRRLAIAAARKVALPFACLVFALLAVPLGSSARSSARSLSALLAVVSVAVYYVLFRLGDHLGEQWGLPPLLSAWLPNLLFLGLAGLLIWRRSRA